MKKAVIFLVIVLLAFTVAISGCTTPVGEGEIKSSDQASDAITEIGEGVSDVGSILEDLDRKLS